MSERILVVDDDASIRRTFERHLSKQGHRVSTAADAEEALAILPEFGPAVVIADVRMPGMDGIELLRRVRSVADDIDFLIITAHEDMETAVTAMKAGAYDYLVKPLDLDAIDLLISRCLAERSLRRRVGHLSQVAAEGHGLEELVGRTPAMIEIYKTIGVLSESPATVLLRGETGTGKECIARAIHFNSSQKDEPFVAVNCTALAETLLESELFGHVKGAFTGAVQTRRGYFELAGTGTVFLDEIGDMSLELQSKLLRVLDQGEFYPVGSEHPRVTEARVIAATHRPLEQLIREDRFREDLYFRLRVVDIVVPPLRERKEDLPLLARHLLGKISLKLHRRIDGISDDALEKLGSYHWPGNVRELENTLTRAAVLSRSPLVSADQISAGMIMSDPGTGPPDDSRQVLHPEGEVGDPSSTPMGTTSLAAVEANHIQRILRQAGGNKRQAARLLDISRQRLDRLLKKHGLWPGSGPSSPDS
jgi:two-component system response regulator AtoC